MLDRALALALAVELVSLTACSAHKDTAAATLADAGGDGGERGESAIVEEVIHEAVPAEVAKPPSDVAAPPPGAEVLRSGVAFRTLRPGSGNDHPGPNDAVTLKLEAWTRDGLAASWTGTDDTTLPVGSVRRSLTDLVAGMVQGEVRQAWVPVQAVAGERIDKDLTLRLELRGIIRGPETPAGIAAPPPGSKKTAAGFPYVLLSAGDPHRKPCPHDLVLLEYSVWTPDSRLVETSMFDRSPGEIAFDILPASWKSAVAITGVNGKVRLWVPAEAAFEAPRPNLPSTLVFDVLIRSVRAENG